MIIWQVRVKWAYSFLVEKSAKMVVFQVSLLLINNTLHIYSQLFDKWIHADQIFSRCTKYSGLCVKLEKIYMNNCPDRRTMTGLLNLSPKCAKLDSWILIFLGLEHRAYIKKLQIMHQVHCTYGYTCTTIKNHYGLLRNC